MVAQNTGSSTHTAHTYVLRRAVVCCAQPHPHSPSSCFWDTETDGALRCHCHHRFSRNASDRMRRACTCAILFLTHKPLGFAKHRFESSTIVCLTTGAPHLHSSRCLLPLTSPFRPQCTAWESRCPKPTSIQYVAFLPLPSHHVLVSWSSFLIAFLRAASSNSALQ